MRTELGKRYGQKEVFTGTFNRYGWRRFRGDYVGKTILLKDIKDSNGNIVTDHLWFHDTKRFRNLGDLKEGEILQFHARVGTYGRDEDTFDYRLEYPEGLIRVSHQQTLQ